VRDESGAVHECRLELKAVEPADKRGISLTGQILIGDRAIGRVTWQFFRDDKGQLVVDNQLIDLHKFFQRQGISNALAAKLEPYYLDCGVDRIEALSVGKSTIVAARQGFTWDDSDPARLRSSLASIRRSLEALLADTNVSDAAKAILEPYKELLEPGHSELPKPIVLANLETPDTPDLGRQLLEGASVYFAKQLYPGYIAAIADEALSERGVGADELVRPLGDAELAVQRAQANAVWSKRLSQYQLRALIQTYPEQIGDAEGIWPLDCHEGNFLKMQQCLRFRDELQSRLDNGAILDLASRAYIERMNRIEADWHRAIEEARAAGVDGPYLLAFNPLAFNEAGRAIVCFTKNCASKSPYEAKKVSWYVPGRGVGIRDIGPLMGHALHNLDAMLRADPKLPAASMLWLGYPTLDQAETPVAEAARVGADLLYCDIRAFNAGYDGWVGDGSHFFDNHIYGHCQGGTVALDAAYDARLDGVAHSVFVAGCVGADLMTQARQAGPNVKIYVAASSDDWFTWQGGHTPGSKGTYGAGVDPAMGSFGADRVTAEISLRQKIISSMQKIIPACRGAGRHRVHLSYFDHVAPGVPGEPLANFGRTVAGLPPKLEDHRRIVVGRFGRSRVVDPAARRRVRLKDLRALGDTGSSGAVVGGSHQAVNYWVGGQHRSLPLDHGREPGDAVGELVDALTRGWLERTDRDWVHLSLLARELVQFAVALFCPGITEHIPAQLEVWVGAGAAGVTKRPEIL
jgi:hypothetical protein